MTLPLDRIWRQTWDPYQLTKYPAVPVDTIIKLLWTDNFDQKSITDNLTVLVRLTSAVRVTNSIESLIEVYNYHQPVNYSFIRAVNQLLIIPSSQLIEAIHNKDGQLIIKYHTSLSTGDLINLAIANSAVIELDSLNVRYNWSDYNFARKINPWIARGANQVARGANQVASQVADRIKVRPTAVKSSFEPLDMIKWYDDELLILSIIESPSTQYVNSLIQIYQMIYSTVKWSTVVKILNRIFELNEASYISLLNEAIVTPIHLNQPSFRIYVATLVNYAGQPVTNSALDQWWRSEVLNKL